MMTITTRRAIENILSRINPDCFSSREIEGIRFETFKKYVSIENYIHEIPHHEELSMEEICDLLNEYERDLWGEGAFFVEDNCTYALENGKIYCNWTETHSRYRILGFKFSNAEG